VIHRLDESDNSLTPVWSLPENHKAWNIGVYAHSGIVVVSEGDWSPQTLHILSTEGSNETQTVPLIDYGRVSKYNILQSKSGTTLVRLLHRQNKDEPQSEMFILFDSGRVVRAPISDIEASELRLAGARTPYGGGEHDVSATRLQPDAPITLIESGILLDGAPVPTSVKQTHSSRGWALVANEPSYRAFWCVPDSHGPTQREVLIHDRTSDTWNSVMVEGSSTGLRPVNTWLLGVVADTHPDTDFHGGGGVPSILREEVVLINPADGRNFTVHLGEDCELLWIEDEIAYYRVGDTLSRARIDGETFVDDVQILSDPIVKQFHWGFSGEE